MAASAVRRDAATTEFFDGTARGQFLLRRCAGCGALAEPYVLRCPDCESAEMSWAPAAGGASVVSWSVVHHRAVGGEVTHPSVVVIGQLDEGPFWWAEVLDADPAELAAGRRLRLTFEHVPDHEVVPAYRLG
jgi:uncharacterized OB-fold protein